MAAKEAKARIKINKLLEESGWRFFDDASGNANIVLEPNVTLTKVKCDALGENFETSGNGFVDFLLLDEQSHPIVVLEAKAEDKNPLIGKEQARSYAHSQRCRYVILSNGNLHYFWDLEQGNPHIITRFPSLDSIKGYQHFQPNPQRLITEIVSKDYIALTQMPGYANEAGWKNETERPGFIAKKPAAISARLSKASRPGASRCRSGRKEPFSVRNGDRHRQNADRRRSHQAFLAHRQRAPRIVSGG